MSPRPKGDQVRERGATRAQIKAVARQQMVEHGTAGISLRGIAREMSITAPAIYNYFPRLDDLVTALIVDAYADFGDSQRAAVATVDPEDHAGRIRALGHAYRRWAVANPERYQLIFGAPYPGYRVPGDAVGPVASRALAVLVGVLEQARLAGVLRAEPPAAPLDVSAQPRSLPQDRVGELYGSADLEVLHAAVSIWTRVHGPVAIELSRQYPPFVTDPERVYGLEMEAIVRSAIKGG